MLGNVMAYSLVDVIHSCYIYYIGDLHLGLCSFGFGELLQNPLMGGYKESPPFFNLTPYVLCIGAFIYYMNVALFGNVAKGAGGIHLHIVFA